MTGRDRDSRAAPAPGGVDTGREAWTHQPESGVSEGDIDLIDAFLPEGAAHVLEAGCGAGGTAIRLAARGLRVTALDPSDRPLALASKAAGEAALPLTLARGSPEALPFADRAFDAVVACRTLEHARDLGASAAELTRVARDRVILIVPRPRPERCTGNHHTVFFPTRSEVIGAFPALRALVATDIHEGAALLYVGEKQPLAVGRTHGFADPAGYQLPGRGAPAWTDRPAGARYETCVMTAWDHARVANPDQALQFLQEAACIAAVAGAPFHEDARVEEVLADLAAITFADEGREARVPRPAGPRPRVGYVVSHLLEGGGHLRTLLNLLEHHGDAIEARVYSTEMAASVDFAPLQLGRLRELGIPFWKPAPALSHLDRARLLRRALIDDGCDVAVLFVNPDDVSASLALRASPPFATVFFHHGANNFSLGANACDHHIDYLDGLLAHCNGLRPMQNRGFIALPGPDPRVAVPAAETDAPRGVPAAGVRGGERDFLGLPPGAVVSFTSATQAKIFEGDRSPYFELLARFLRAAPGVHHVLLLYGHGMREEWLRDWLAMNPDIAPRIHPIARVPSLLPVFTGVDLLLDSVPLGGGNVTIEAMASGLPVVTLGQKGPIPTGPDEMVALEACVARDEEDYLAKALRFAGDAALRRSTGAALRARFEERHEPALVAHAFESRYLAAVEARRAAWRRPVKSPYRASVILVTDAGVAAAEKCLAAIAGNTDDALDFEVVVVADGDGRGVQELLARLEGDVTTLVHHVRAGLARSRNDAARRTRGEYLVFVDSRVEVLPRWLEPLISALDADPALGAAGPRLVTAEGRVLGAGLVASGWLLGTTLRFHARYERQSAELPGVLRAAEFQALGGACLAVRRHAFEAVGGYHPNLGGVSADADLGLKLRRAGYAVRYEPGSTVIVEDTAPGGESPDPDLRILDAARDLRLRDLWSGIVATDEVRRYLEDGLVMTRTPAGLHWLPWAAPR